MELENYAQRMVWRREDAEDVLQNAVMRAFAAFDRYRENASFRAWMYRILTNEIYAINRRHKRSEILAEAEVVDALAALEDTAAYTDWLVNPDRLLDALDDKIVDSLDLLTENERGVLLLRAIGGFRYKEIAESMQIPVGSVMGHLARARGKMRRALCPEIQSTRMP